MYAWGTLLEGSCLVRSRNILSPGDIAVVRNIYGTSKCIRDPIYNAWRILPKLVNPKP